MSKFIGSILIITVSILLGILPVYHLHVQKRYLFDLSCILEKLAAALSNTMSPIPQLLLQLSNESSSSAADLFKNTSQTIEEKGCAHLESAWSTSIDKASDRLNDADKAELLKLGQVLGRYPCNDQIQCLHQISDYFYRRQNELSQKILQNQKLYFSCALSAGLMLVIVLL